MLCSMTGFGAGRVETDALSVAVEIRGVNHRHLKLTLRGSEPYASASWEAEFEKLLRPTVQRGSLLIHVHVQRTKSTQATQLNSAKLAGLLEELTQLCNQQNKLDLLPHLVSGTLLVPGIVAEATVLPATEQEWPVVAEAVRAALVPFQTSRQSEGEAMAAELRAKHRNISEALSAVKTHLPQMMIDYRQRLVERVQEAVKSAGVLVEPAHLVREIALYADRTDVNEEIHRLSHHLEQFEELIGTGHADGTGRRIEFLIQEMGREINTLGSKAGDVTISRLVFDMKTAAEQIRELVANIE